MKAGVAAMCVAAWQAAQRGLRGEIIVAAVIDEEFESLGTRAMLERGHTRRCRGRHRTDATCDLSGTPRLRVARVHLHGPGGSRQPLRHRYRRHPNTRPASLSRSNDFSARCCRRERTRCLAAHRSRIDDLPAAWAGAHIPSTARLRVERRTVPGETTASVLHEVEAILPGSVTTTLTAARDRARRHVARAK